MSLFLVPSSFYKNSFFPKQFILKKTPLMTRSGDKGAINDLRDFLWKDL